MSRVILLVLGLVWGLGCWMPVSGLGAFAEPLTVRLPTTGEKDLWSLKIGGRQGIDFLKTFLLISECLKIRSSDVWVNLGPFVPEWGIVSEDLLSIPSGRRLASLDLLLKERVLFWLEREGVTPEEGLILRWWIEPEEVRGQISDSAIVLKSVRFRVRFVSRGPISRATERKLQRIVDLLTREVNEDPSFRFLRDFYESYLVSRFLLAKGYKPFNENVGNAWSKREVLDQYFSMSSSDVDWGGLSLSEVALPKGEVPDKGTWVNKFFRLGIFETGVVVDGKEDLSRCKIRWRLNRSGEAPKEAVASRWGKISDAKTIGLLLSGLFESKSGKAHEASRYLISLISEIFEYLKGKDPSFEVAIYRLPSNVRDNDFYGLVFERKSSDRHFRGIVMSPECFLEDQLTEVGKVVLTHELLHILVSSAGLKMKRDFSYGDRHEFKEWILWDPDTDRILLSLSRDEIESRFSESEVNAYLGKIKKVARRRELEDEVSVEDRKVLEFLVCAFAKGGFPIEISYFWNQLLINLALKKAEMMEGEEQYLIAVRTFVQFLNSMGCPGDIKLDILRTVFSKSEMFNLDKIEEMISSMKVFYENLGPDIWGLRGKERGQVNRLFWNTILYVYALHFPVVRRWQEDYNTFLTRTNNMLMRTQRHFSPSEVRTFYGLVRLIMSNHKLVRIWNKMTENWKGIFSSPRDLYDTFVGLYRDYLADALYIFPFERLIDFYPEKDWLEVEIVEHGVTVGIPVRWAGDYSAKDLWGLVVENFSPSFQERISEIISGIEDKRVQVYLLPAGALTLPLVFDQKRSALFVSEKFWNEENKTFTSEGKVFLSLAIAELVFDTKPSLKALFEDLALSNPIQKSFWYIALNCFTTQSGKSRRPMIWFWLFRSMNPKRFVRLQSMLLFYSGRIKSTALYEKGTIYAQEVSKNLRAKGQEGILAEVLSLEPLKKGTLTFRDYKNLKRFAYLQVKRLVDREGFLYSLLSGEPWLNFYLEEAKSYLKLVENAPQIMRERVTFALWIVLVDTMKRTNLVERKLEVQDQFVEAVFRSAYVLIRKPMKISWDLVLYLRDKMTSHCEKGMTEKGGIDLAASAL